MKKQVAGHGLAENAQLFLLTLALGAAAALAAAPQLVGALASLSLGALVPNPEIPPGELCAAGGDVACCAWRPAGAGLAGVAASLTAAAWVFLTLQQVRVFTVAGTVAQWYFSPAGTSSNSGATRRSLKHALRASLGTNAFAGAVLALTSAVRQAASSGGGGGDGNGNGGGSLLGAVAGAFASSAAAVLEYLNKFAVVQAAITGEPLLAAGRRVTDLLGRNLLSAVATTVWFPSMLVGLASVTVSLLWGGFVWGAYRLAHGGGAGGELNAPANAVVLGVAAGAAALAVLSFLAGVLLSVLDAVFVCFAMDRDRQEISNAELYEALLSVAEGAAVEHPGGGVEYGRPVGGYEPPAAARA